MGFFDKLVSAGSKAASYVEQNGTRMREDFDRKLDYETRAARGKSSDELRSQMSNKNESTIKRYAAKSELERRS